MQGELFNEVLYHFRALKRGRAAGIALYVVVSMLLKIPMIGHISLDLGYIVLAFWCMMFGPVSAGLVGCGGAFLVSLIASGWIAFGWPLGNLLIGVVCALVYKPDKPIRNVAITVLMVFIGVLGIKTAVECPLYGIPIMVKIPKNAVAAVADTITMTVGARMAGKCYDRLAKIIKN